VKLYVGDYNLSSWSLRPWLVLTHAQIPFETEVIRLDRPETRAALAEVSPSQKVPVLHDGPTVIWESLAICEYAAELAASSGSAAGGHARLWPTDKAVRAVARAVASEMHAGFSSLRSQHPMDFVGARLAERLPKAPTPEVQADLARIKALWKELRERYGAGGPWLFGNFSIADAMFAPVASRFRTYDLPTDEVSREYIATVFDHPAMREWERRAQEEVALSQSSTANLSRPV
jgi:glutathione S-transferase